MKKAWLCGLFSGALAVSPLPAQAQCLNLARSVLFEKLTWTEIAQDISCGFTTIIVPVGGTEQSGPYIAVGKHNSRVQFQAERIARQSGRTLVAPVVAYVPEGGTAPRTSHMRFPGTITLPPDVFDRMLASIAESFRVQGFKLVVLIGDHGGYQKDMEKLATQLNVRWQATGARVLYVQDYYNVIPHQYSEWLRQNGYRLDVGQHADIGDTSLMLAVDPSMVREEALRHAPNPSAAQGIYGGDPRRATSTLGQPGLSMQVDAAVKAIDDARSK
ncbi:MULTISPECIES: creatininase family protein [Acetobacter]|uniref:creatininase family protein n=1 Tax=Acetobacter TaxID=434 RepID=UPI00376FF152